jgi:hypothetical protein
MPEAQSDEMLITTARCKNQPRGSADAGLDGRIEEFFSIYVFRQFQPQYRAADRFPGSGFPSKGYLSIMYMIIRDLDDESVTYTCYRQLHKRQRVDNDNVYVTVVWRF